MRRISLLAGVIAALTVTLVVLAGGEDGLPRCDGSFQGTIDRAPDAGFSTREGAAAEALAVFYDVEPHHLVLEEEGGGLYKVTELNGVAVEAPPTVSIERVDQGFVATGITC